MGVQFAKLAGLTVPATASGPESAAWAKSLGADHILDHTKPMRPRVENAGWSFIDYIIEQHRLLARIAQWFDEGILRMIMREGLTPIDAANLRLAHSKIESGSMIGKMVLEGC
ncbi:MAG TPA: zinc-binding dehydrogenase [Nitrospiraceae bacterium]|nr:zinc-binding dehydrogenase [Nitrospiraceae bacterium]